MTDSPENVSRWELLFARKLEMEAVEAFRFFRSKGIEPILIKGWAAARNYPPDRPRSYIDVDLAVAADSFSEAKHAMATDKGLKIGVDLHRELRHLDTKPWSELLDDSVLVNMDGYQLRTPCAEDHLRIMSAHWLNDGGERKDRLWDIYYAVLNRPADFDWGKCLDAVSKSRRFWVVATIGLANRYLGLSLEGLPFEREATALPEWLLKAVEFEWRSGVRQRSLHTCLREPREFIRQIRKRLPPNAIQATIEMDGDLRGGSRLPYQMGSLKKRLWPSVRGMAKVLRARQ